MDISEVGIFGLNLIRKRARTLIGQFGFTRSDYDDLQQRMLLDLVRRLAKFNPSLSPRNAFITRVVNNAVAWIIKQQTGPARQVVRDEVSLHQKLDGPGGERELDEVLADRRQPTAESLGMAADLKRAVATLPAGLRDLWEQRVQGLTLTEISSRTGIPRTTLEGRWDKVCQHLQRAGMGDYFA